MSKKINIILAIVVLVLFSLAGFFGYKSKTQANVDAVCSYTLITNITLEEKVKSSCSNISWGEWKKNGNNESRVGSGLMNIVNYSKNVLKKERKTRRGLPNRLGCAGITDQKISGGTKIQKGLSKQLDSSFRITRTPYVCSVKQSRVFKKENKTDGNKSGNNDGKSNNSKNGSADSQSVIEEVTVKEKKGAEEVVNAGKIISQNISQNIQCSSDKKKWFNCNEKVIKLLDINTPFYIKTNLSESCLADSDTIASFKNLGTSYFTYEEVEKISDLEHVATVKAAVKNGGKVIEQKVESSYCLDRSKASDFVKVKIVNLKVKEI